MSRVGGFGDWISGFTKAVAHYPFTVAKDSIEVVMYIIDRDWP